MGYTPIPRVYHPIHFTSEQATEARIERVRERYVKGLIDLEEFEDLVDTILATPGRRWTHERGWGDW